MWHSALQANAWIVMTSRGMSSPPASWQVWTPIVKASFQVADYISYACSCGRGRCCSSNSTTFIFQGRHSAIVNLRCNHPASSYIQLWQWRVCNCWTPRTSCARVSVSDPAFEQITRIGAEHFPSWWTPNPPAPPGCSIPMTNKYLYHMIQPIYSQFEDCARKSCTRSLC